MRAERKYLKSVVLGFLLGTIIFTGAVLFQMGAPNDAAANVDNFLQYKSKIYQQYSQPKILILSGSNSLYGISCKMIQEETQVFCFNGAVFEPLGVDYILNRIGVKWLQEGDTVLLPLEYSFYEDIEIRKMLMDYVFSYDAQYIRQGLNSLVFFSKIELNTLWENIKNKINNKQIKPKFIMEEYYNSYGDAYHNTKESMEKEKIEKLKKVRPVNSLRNGFINKSTGMNSINKFIKYCQKNNIKVIATWPNTIWFEEYKQEKTQKFIESIEIFYRKNNIDMLGKAYDFMYDKSMFFDSVYHLNDQGVKQRTQQIIELLQPYLNN